MPCTQVRTQTLVKNAIIQVDATPFKQWYATHYAVELGGKGKEEAPKIDDKKVRMLAISCVYSCVGGRGRGEAGAGSRERVGQPCSVQRACHMAWLRHRDQQHRMGKQRAREQEQQGRRWQQPQEQEARSGAALRAHHAARATDSSEAVDSSFC